MASGAVEVLEELASVLSKDAAEGVGEAGQSGKAAGEASKAVDEAIIQNSSADLEIGVDGKASEPGVEIEPEVKEGMEESQKEVKDMVEKLEEGAPNAAEEAKALEGVWKERFKNVWAGAKTFGSFVAVEALKGGLFYAGMKAIEALWVKMFPPHQPEGSGHGQTVAPVDDERVKIIKTINKAGEIIQKSLDSWSKWQAAHYNDRDSYGSVTVSGLSIQLFQVLQSAVAAAGEKRDKMVPLVTKAKTEKSVESVRALLAADIEYARGVVDLADQIGSKMTAMIDGGLPNKHADVQAAYDMLVAASA